MRLSGADKSTLIRMVNGLIEPTEATLLIQDREIEHLSTEGLREIRRRNISMVFQHFALLPHLTVGENAAYALKIRGVSKSAPERAAAEAMRRGDRTPAGILRESDVAQPVRG